MDAKTRVTTSIEDAKSDLDRALAELEQLQTFDPARVGFVAHALNNYLTVTLITMEMLSHALADHPNPDVRTWIDGVQHATHVMKYTVGKLLQVSAPADFPLKLEAVNIVVLMDKACQYFKGVARHKGIDISHTVSANVPLVLADRIALAVVAENLISNAVKFSSSGTTVQVEIVGEPAHVVCVVSDDGPGLSPEDQARLYQKGVTLSAAPTAGEPSSGFGLALAKALVDRMDGTLWCESQPGKGARFSFRLPNSTTLQ
jgi:signal transduction histidine kinase